MERFIKIGTWAKLAEMTREGAYKRIKSGKLKTSSANPVENYLPAVEEK